MCYAFLACRRRQPLHISSPQSPQGNVQQVIFGENPNDSIQHHCVSRVRVRPTMVDNSIEEVSSSSDGKQEEQSEELAPSTGLGLPLWREILVGLVCCSCQLIMQVGIGQVLGPLSLLLSDFPKLVDLYPVMAGSFMLVSGRLGDLYGHRTMLVTGFAWLSVWSLVTGLSGLTKSSTFWSIARGFQGVGPAFLIPNAAAILYETMAPGRKLNMWMAVWGSLVPTGFVLGAVFAGIFGELAWWPWSFWSLAIASCVAAILALFIIPPNDRKTKDGWRQINYLGAVLGVPGLVLVNVAWTRGWQAGWTVPYTYILLIVGSLLFGLYLLVDSRSNYPWVPFRDIKPRGLLLLLVGACSFGAFGIWLFFTLQFLHLLRHATILSAAAQTVPACVCGLLSSIVFGYLFQCNIAHALIMVWSTSLFLAANIMLATQPIHQTYWAQTFLSFIFGPLAMDAAVPTCIILFSSITSPERQGIAMALVNTVINYMIPLATAVAGTALRYQTFGPSPDEILHGIRSAAYVGIAISSLGLLGAITGTIITYPSQTRALFLLRKP